jgi:hypothetical protein
MELVETTPEQRLKVYNLVSAGCQHFYSKNKPQDEKIVSALMDIYPLAKGDPIFLAHLAAWAAKGKSKDLKRTAVYINALSDGDGTPFVVGGTERKPNLRSISWALLSGFNPKELSRLLYFRKLKWQPVDNNCADTHRQTRRQASVHFPRSFSHAIAEYLKNKPVHEIKRDVESEFTRHLINCHKQLRIAPSDTMVKLLKWKQKDGRDYKTEFVNPFAGLTDKEIARKIETEKIPFLKALALVPEVSPVILSALFEVASPNQLIVRVRTYEESGLLSIPEFAERFYAKIEQGSSVDRIDRLAKSASEPVKERLQEARSRGRKIQFGHLDGRLWLDIDISMSMSNAISTAKEHAATFLDVVGGENFEWGLVGSGGRPVNEKPTSKEKAHKALFGITASDRTSDLLYNYRAVQAGPEPVDYWVSITDGGLNYGKEPITHLPKVKNFTIVHLGDKYPNLGNFLRANGIEPHYLPPEALQESALVAQAIKNAVRGSFAVIDEIMSTPLPIRIS